MAVLEMIRPGAVFTGVTLEDKLLAVLPFYHMYGSYPSIFCSMRISPTLFLGLVNFVLFSLRYCIPAVFLSRFEPTVIHTR